MEVLILLAIWCLGMVSIGFTIICFNDKRTVLRHNESSDQTTKIGFWRKQFQSGSSQNQRVFDWMFGVIMPVVCFTFDPIVFKGGGELLGDIKPFAYLLSFASIMAMMAWLIWGEKLKALNGLLAGFFALSGVISIAIGTVLLPFSLIGLIMLIGILGFTPLFTGVVFLRNAKRAYHASKPFWAGRQVIGPAILSAIFAFVIPFTINMEIKRLIDGMINGDVATIQRNARILKFVAPIANFKMLIGKYPVDEPPERQRAFAEAYEQLTGEHIETSWLGLDIN